MSSTSISAHVSTRHYSPNAKFFRTDVEVWGNRFDKYTVSMITALARLTELLKEALAKNATFISA